MRSIQIATILQFVKPYSAHAGEARRQGSRRSTLLTRFGSPEAPWFEVAMICRAQENDIFFASANFAHAYQTAATAVIGPGGQCLVHAPYGEPGVVFAEIDPAAADGLYAKRLAPATYRDADA